MDIKKILNSFRFAGEGLVSVFKEEQNFRVETLFFVAMLGLIFYFPVTVVEGVILFLVAVNILIMEILNTVLERLLDLRTTRKTKKFKFLKDIMASAVLLNVLVAIVVTVFILGQYIIE